MIRLASPLAVLFHSIMIRSLGLLLLAVALTKASDVIELSDSNFKEGTNQDIMLVEFFAPW